MSAVLDAYYKIKADNPGGLLFFRMGDFYEAFADDAVAVSKALGITLAKRGDIAMCGVPAHSSRGYFAALADSGNRVDVYRYAPRARKFVRDEGAL